jgi:gluconolactonase
MIFASGLDQPERPVLLSDGSCLVTEMGESRGCITHLTNRGQIDRTIALTGRPNGLALDRNRVIWIAESKKACLLKAQMDGIVEIWLYSCGEASFLLPNDLAFGPDGMLYMTNSGIPIEKFAPNERPHLKFRNLQSYGCVYRINPQTREIKKIDYGLLFPNGIAFSPDRLLNINETLIGNVFCYPTSTEKAGSKRELFGNVLYPCEPDFIGGPDGMKLRQAGRLYIGVFARRDVTILNLDRSLYERKTTQGRLPTNLAFVSHGSQMLYVTEESLGAIEVFSIVTDGLPLGYST